jgi:hypothetical protein
VERSGGHPYFLQEYGRVLWDEIDSPPVTAEHVRTVEEIVEDSLDRGFFAPAFELATDAEQRYLIAISGLGEGPYRTAEAAAAAGYSSIGGASAVRLRSVAPYFRGATTIAVIATSAETARTTTGASGRRQRSLASADAGGGVLPTRRGVPSQARRSLLVWTRSETFRDRLGAPEPGSPRCAPWSSP